MMGQENNFELLELKLSKRLVPKNDSILLRK